MYFLSELVTRVSTSWFSSRSKLVARCPRRLSANRGEARSFKHSICPKWVRSPKVKRYRSFATLFRLQSVVSQDVPCSSYSYPSRRRGRHAPNVVVVAILSEAGTNRSALLLDDGSLVGNGLGGPHVADELFDCITKKDQPGSRESISRNRERTGTHLGGQWSTRRLGRLGGARLGVDGDE